MKNNKAIKFLTLVICIFLMTFAVNANENALKIEHRIDSKFPVEKRTFSVHLPESYYSQTSYKYPVLFLLDGKSNLGYSKTIETFMAENAIAPELIIVAIETESAKRQRDYLPINDDKRFSGNAKEFLKHIEQELVPFLEKNYRAAPFRILSGHSYGGVFVTDTLIEKPKLFQAYFAQSPYLDKSIGDPLVERMKKLLEKKSKLNAFYYMNIGNEPNLKQNFDEMKSLFKSNASKSFRWLAEDHPNKNHMTTRFIGQYNALENLFAKDWTLSQQEIAAGKFVKLSKHINKLSMKYGYSVLYSEQTFTNATQMFLSMKDVNSAVKTAELFTKQYPNSFLGNFFLAISYRSGGNNEKALKAAKTAVKVYEANPNEELKPLYENIKRLQ